MHLIPTEFRHFFRFGLAALFGAAALFSGLPANAADPVQIKPEVYCQWPEDQRVSLLAKEVQSAWYDLDVNGRANLGRMNPHSSNFGVSPLAEGDRMRARMGHFKIQLQQLMVRTGVLFPEYSRPSDGAMLIDRFITRSVPIYGSSSEHQVATMEAYLLADDENRERGIAYIEALHALEESSLALSSGQTAPKFNDQNQVLQDTFHGFMTALRAALFSPAFEKILARRITPYCADVLAEQQAAGDTNEEGN